MRNILSFFIILFLLGGYITDILNAAPACTWRYKWVWDGATRYACEVQIPSAGCGTLNGRQKRTAKCVREDGDGTSVAVAVANCATWDPYTGAKSLIETYDNGTCTMPCNASCGTSNGSYTASQPASNLCDSTATNIPTGITWTDTTAVASDYTYNWSCASKNGGSPANCYAYKPTTGSCNNTVALGCSIGSAYNDNNQTACNATRAWNCSGINTGGSSAGCSKANAVCCVANMGQACTETYPPIWSCGIKTEDYGSAAGCGGAITSTNTSPTGGGAYSQASDPSGTILWACGQGGSTFKQTAVSCTISTAGSTVNGTIQCNGGCAP